MGFIYNDKKEPLFTQLTGSYQRLSTEPKPTITDGAKNGDDLLIVDTGQIFIYYNGEWYEQ